MTRTTPTTSCPPALPALPARLGAPLLAAAWLLATPAHAWQAGDAKDPGAVQAPLPADLTVPPAPVVPPADAPATLMLEPGFEAALVAAEPLVEDPVAVTFDERGRLWVVEMRGFMPDADGTGETEPVGQIAILSDTDADGHFDKRVTFLDELVLPRAVAPTRGGALVLAPPTLRFYTDTDGDGRADHSTIVDTNLPGRDSPEHAVNGLLWTLDGTFACANHDRCYRWDRTQEKWVAELTSGGGQWGISADNLGRRFYNTNSSALRADLVDSRYGRRNPHHGSVPGLNVTVVSDGRTWPVRITPGVNRGYQPNILSDWKLASVTAACGPHIERGALFPGSHDGHAFVCEPAGNLIKHYVLSEDGAGVVTGRILHEDSEFLASTDERFRPVNIVGGPDGALYVVDMYRGILQHRIFMTTFLRRQVEERGLDRPVGLGRIWRVTPTGNSQGLTAWRDLLQRPLDERPSTELVALLAHAEGWWRDTAQRVLIERGQTSTGTLAALRELLQQSPSPFARLHALWTLRALGLLTEQDVRTGLADADERVVHEAVRVSESLLAAVRPDPFGQDLLGALRRVGLDGSLRLRRQVLLSLGAARNSHADGATGTLLSRDASTPELRSAVMSGLRGRELVFLERLLASPTWRRHETGRDAFVRLLARAIVREGRGERIDALLSHVASARDWQQRALLSGVLEGREMGPDGKPAPIHLTAPPARLDSLHSLPSQDAFGLALQVVSYLTWPGRVGGPEQIEVRPLNSAEHTLFADGQALYALACASCHQSSGRGEAGKAPPLRGSPYVLGPPEPLVAIVLHGLHGPLELEGVTWDLEMPAQPVDNLAMAGLLTYLRREWGHGANPIDSEVVAAVRAHTAERDEPWTVETLTAAGLERILVGAPTR